jgi:hypothetical protein
MIVAVLLLHILCKAGMHQGRLEPAWQPLLVAADITNHCLCAAYIQKLCCLFACLPASVCPCCCCC